MIDNLDCGITIARDWDSDGQMYMTFHRIKMRDKGSVREYIAQPFLPDNSIRLLEDFGGIPQFKESIHTIPGFAGMQNKTHVKIDGASSLSKVIDVDDSDNDDNAFNKNSFNLNPISATDNSTEFQSQMDMFDDGLSELIIENNEAMKNIENFNRSSESIYNLSNPVKVRKAITFCPIKKLA
jgi:hypothetical protein